MSAEAKAKRKVERIGLKVAEVAAAIGCNEQSIYRAIRSGDLPAGRLWPNGDLIILADDVRETIRKNRVGSADAAS